MSRDGAGRTTFIQRSSVPSAMSSCPSFPRQSLGGSTSFQHGLLSKMSNDSVSDVRAGREKERKEMQGLNERFASYIEKVRYLEAQNKQLLADLEREKKKKCLDVDKIKQMYEVELEQARNVINHLSKEKGEVDARAIGLKDALETECSL
jgi:intermediate filament protein if